MAELWDVVVAGAGPAGSATALLLARAGYRVALLERAHFPRPKACAEFLSPGTVEVLARLDCAGVLTEAAAHAFPGMDIISPRGSVLRIQYSDADAPRYARSLPRLQLDAALAEHAVEAGACLRQGFLVQKPLVENGWVRGVRGRTTNGEETIRSRLTVVADGGQSAMAAALGVRRPARWPVRLGLVAHLQGDAGLLDGFGQMHVGRGGYCGVAPLPDGRLNVAIVVKADAVRRSALNASQFFESWIASTPALAATLSGYRRATAVRGLAPIGARTRRAWAPGCLLVGDAASFFDPFTGEGIFRALVGAELAMQVAIPALEDGDPGPRSLAVYDDLRRKAFRRKEMVTALVQLFVQYPWLMEYALPRLTRRPSPRDTLNRVLGDIADAGDFLRPRVLWSALRP